MPLAEAITQLSFLEFLQRCGVSIAPPQPAQPPVSISLLEAAVQTTTPCYVSQDVSTQTSHNRTRFFFLRKNERKSVTQSTTTDGKSTQAPDEPLPHANLLSLNTRAPLTSTPVPGFGCKRDNAKALAALLLHLRRHAALTRFWRSKGADRECALARARKNCAVSRPSPTDLSSKDHQACPSSFS